MLSALKWTEIKRLPLQFAKLSSRLDDAPNNGMTSQYVTIAYIPKHISKYLRTCVCVRTFALVYWGALVKWV